MDDYMKKLMANNDDYIIVSVESRKGGVGKTTVVLNMAKLLMKHYHVLVLDVDVTGTSINAIQNTNVWQKSTRLLEGEKGKAINLLQFFKKQYLSGSNNMRFSTKPTSGEVRVYEDYINVIGSELYDTEGQMLYDPSVIFDEIHDYWLLDMIRSIAHSFSESFDDEKKSVIILDNSPGYVGLGKSIHDMLTDMGPVRGKFLSVSSLDIQDIDSCLKAVKNIHNLIQAKEKGAAFYHDSGNVNLNSLHVGSVEQETFDRLAIGDETLGFYSNEKLVPSEIDDYQAIVFNKVPLNVKNGRLVYQYSNKGNKELWDVFTRICENNPNQFMIPYDESIHYQFFKNNLTLSKPIEESKHEHLEKQLESLGKRAQRLEMYFRDNEWRRIAYQLNTLNRDLGRIPDSLNETGQYEHASHINPSWFPESTFKELFRQLQDMQLVSNSRNFYFPYFLPQAFIFEERFNFDFLSNYPEITCAVKAIFAVLESLLRKETEGLLTACAYAEDILKRCFVKDNLMAAEGYKGWHVMKYISTLRDDAYKPEQFFQLVFLETLVRVLELPEDIMLICDSVELLTDYRATDRVETDANVSWILDKRILNKEMPYKEAKALVNKEVSESDYMAIVRQVITPIIVKWGL